MSEQAKHTEERAVKVISTHRVTLQMTNEFTRFFQLPLTKVLKLIKIKTIANYLSY
jgi:hypothetical protein